MSDVSTAADVDGSLTTTVHSATIANLTVTGAPAGTTFQAVQSYVAVDPVVVREASGPPLAVGSTLKETSYQIEPGPIDLLETSTSSGPGSQPILTLIAPTVPASTASSNAAQS